ncbi:MAG: STAS domain-containing protein [Pyrinomonadaceae bacterium]
MLNVHFKNLETVAVVSLQGQLVNGETDNLRGIVQSLGEVKVVILDLAQVKIVDARGLGVMLELREQAQAKGIRFELMNVSKWVSKVLEIARLDAVFQIGTAVEFFPATVGQRRGAMPRLASCA